MEYTTSDYSFGPERLPDSRSGFVSKKNFQKYYGCFSGRAYFASERIPFLCFLKVKRSHLEYMYGLKCDLASAILERQKNSYQNCEDLLNAVPELQNSLKSELIQRCCKRDPQNKVGPFP